MTTHKFNCPQCEKSYVAKTSQLVIGANFFDCVDCKVEFQMSFDGSDLQLLDFKKNGLRSCPQCSFEYPLSQPDCPHCGVIASKFQQKAPTQLRELWAYVLDHFDDPEAHQKFVRLAAKLNLSHFALACYRGIAEALPHDEVAQQMLEQLRVAETARVLAAPPELERSQQLPNRRYWLLVPLIAALLLIGVGIIDVEKRNLVGIGAMVAFLNIGLVLQFSGISFFDFRSRS